MLRVEPLAVGDRQAIGIEVRLPGTTLLVVTTGIGYIMCGALDVHLLNTRLKDRRIVAGRAVGVRTIEELLAAPLESVTSAAEALGVTAGMPGREAVRLMLDAEEQRA
mgnify:CR=1 FL=1|jgi:uncharacterized protein YunC (DUF1805 family)